MTALIQQDGHPDLLACEHCGCHIAARRTGMPWQAVVPGGGYAEDGWIREVGVDEPPLHVDLNDGCPCHDAYNRLQRNGYDR